MEGSSRSLRDRFTDGVRVFNKHIFNRFTLFIARRGIGPFSVITHIGRRSGRRYETPVLASYVGGRIVIPLSYGVHVDWLRNVIAQGGCEIRWKKNAIRASAPEIVDAETAYRDLPPDRRRLFQRFEIDQYVRMEGRIEDEGQG